MKLLKKDKIRFWKKVQIKKTDDCWEWQAARNNGGYGVLNLSGTPTLAHRIAWFLTNGKIPKKRPSILHRCNNTGCVNPGHLYAGTAKDNARDAMLAGTFHILTPRLGEDHHQKKLTNEDVLSICDAEGTQQEMADQYGVSRSMISFIRNGKRWKHLTEPKPF